MKRIIVFLIVIGVLTAGYFLTKGYTYMNGALSANGIFLFQAVAAGVLAFALSYALAPFARRCSEKARIVPFREW